MIWRMDELCAYTPRSISEIEILIIENIIATMETTGKFRSDNIYGEEATHILKRATHI